MEPVVVVLNEFAGHPVQDEPSKKYPTSQHWSIEVKPVLAGSEFAGQRVQDDELSRK